MQWISFIVCLMTAPQIMIATISLVSGYRVSWLLVIGVSRTMLMAGGFRSKACRRLYGQILNNNHCTTYSLCETKSTFN